MHILDIAMNSMAAGAHTVQITVIEDTQRDLLTLRIQDDGGGMDAAMLQKVSTQATTTKRSRRKPIGLGLAFLRQTAEMCAGRFEIESAPNAGTKVTASMQRSHVDCPPLGDLNATVLTLCAANPVVDVQLHYRSDGEQFDFSSKKLAEQTPARRSGIYPERQKAN